MNDVLAMTSQNANLLPLRYDIQLVKLIKRRIYNNDEYKERFSQVCC